MVLLHLLPTDSRILGLRDWECEVYLRMLGLDAVRRRREAEGLPAATLEDLTGETRFAEGEAKLDAQWAQEAQERAAQALLTDGDALT